MSLALLDTGALVAFLDAGDPSHERVADAIDAYAGTFVTTGAVVTEASYLLRHARDGTERLVDFLEQSATKIADVFTMDILHAVARLMQQYSDRPMDFADGTLVLVAEEFGCDAIFTLDVRGFRAFRFQGNRRFRLLIQDGGL